MALMPSALTASRFLVLHVPAARARDPVCARSDNEDAGHNKIADSQESKATWSRVLSVDVGWGNSGELGQLHDHGASPAGRPMHQNGAGVIDPISGHSVQHLVRCDSRKDHGHNLLRIEAGIDLHAEMLRQHYFCCHTTILRHANDNIPRLHHGYSTTNRNHCSNKVVARGYRKREIRSVIASKDQ